MQHYKNIHLIETLSTLTYYLGDKERRSYPLALNKCGKMRNCLSSAEMGIPQKVVVFLSLAGYIVTLCQIVPYI
jgi:hypothetical protein